MYMGDRYRRMWSVAVRWRHMWLIQPEAHTAARGSLTVNAGAMEVTLVVIKDTLVMIVFKLLNLILLKVGGLSE